MSPRDRVILSHHACDRWEERTGRKARGASAFLTAILQDRLAIHLPVEGGYALLRLDAEAYGLPRDIEVPLVFPDGRGVWVATTVLYGEEE